MSSVFSGKSTGYVAGLLGIAAVTAVGAPFHEIVAHTTIALAYLLVVLFVATAWGSWPASVASALGVLCFNFFFLPPVYTLTIADPQNWVALAAFLVTAVTAGRLSDLAKRRAADAEAVRTAARLASARNRSLLEASLDALVTIGTDGRIDDVNSAIETLTGRSRTALIGTDFSECFTEPEQARALYREVLREGFVRDRPLELRHQNGHVTRVLYNASLHRADDGSVIGVVAAARSISTSAGRPVTVASDADVVRALNRFVAFASRLFTRGRSVGSDRLDARHRGVQERDPGSGDHQAECRDRSGVVWRFVVAVAQHRHAVPEGIEEARRPGVGVGCCPGGSAEPVGTSDRLGRRHRSAVLPRREPVGGVRERAAGADRADHGAGFPAARARAAVAGLDDRVPVAALSTGAVPGLRGQHGCHRRTPRLSARVSHVLHPHRPADRRHLVRAVVRGGLRAHRLGTRCPDHQLELWRRAHATVVARGDCRSAADRQRVMDGLFRGPVLRMGRDHGHDRRDDHAAGRFDGGERPEHRAQRLGTPASRSVVASKRAGTERGAAAGAGGQLVVGSDDRYRHVVGRTVSHRRPRSEDTAPGLQGPRRLLHDRELRATERRGGAGRANGNVVRARAGDGARRWCSPIRHEPRGSGARSRWSCRARARHHP